MKKILLSLVNIFLLLAIFTIGTYAWFYDSATNENNMIRVGNLKVSVVVADGIQSYTSGENTYYDLNTSNLLNLKEDTQAMFDFDHLVEPGNTLTRFIRIKNIGSIDMAYRISFIVSEDFLSEYIEFSITRYSTLDGTAYESTQNIKGSMLTDQLKLMENEGIMVHQDYELFRIDMKILDTLSNDYNDDVLSSNAFVFDVRLDAWQANYPESEPA